MAYVEKHSTKAGEILTILAFLGIPIGGALFTAYLVSKQKTLKAGREYLIHFNIKPPLPSEESRKAFEAGLIQSGGTSVALLHSGGSYVAHPQTDQFMVMEQPLVTMNVEGRLTSVIPLTVKEI